MMTMAKVQKCLRQKNKKNYILYVFCNFLALMLITAYSVMMYSPTVLEVLPEGGDSRKQMIAIFVMACVGCTVFTIYAVSLFYRMKSREIGVFFALGASRKVLLPTLLKETMLLSGCAALAGTVAGVPFAWGIWQSFRLFIVDTQEMVFKFDWKCLWVSAVFFVIILGAACFYTKRYLRKTNIMEVIQEEHRNEPVRELGRWCGPVGFLVLLAGGIGGYSASGIYMDLFSAYPPGWINLFYTPVFIGLYMILLHTVVNGWRRRKNNPYKGIISRSMMKFQGKQTVNNMMVVAVLVAGACFGLFYLPINRTAQTMEIEERAYDYFYQYRQDQQGLDKPQVEQIARKNAVTVSDWMTADYATVAMDGEGQVEDENDKFHYEYFELLNEGKILSESNFEKFTGQSVDVQRGMYYAIDTEEETNIYLNIGATLLTNMVTGEKLPVQFGGRLHESLLVDSKGYYVLADEDYLRITAGISDEWLGTMVKFNAGESDSYQFASELYDEFVKSFDEDCGYGIYYDRVQKADMESKGQTYGDNDVTLNYDERNSSEFRLFWTYMPKFRIMDKNDGLKTLGVFLMMFLFIAIICMAAALIICYTRCIAIAINNKYVFEDLKRLGASPRFLDKEIRRQTSSVFVIPSLVGMFVIYLLYTMIIYANDGRITGNEEIALLICLGLVVGIFAGIYFVSRITAEKMKKQIGI